MSTLLQANDTGCYSVKASNTVGEAICAADFEIRPPPPQDHQETELPPPRPPSPKAEHLSKGIRQSKESSTLQILAGFRYTDKLLPELIPFPYKPEKVDEKPKCYGKVAKPSKFAFRSRRSD